MSTDFYTEMAEVAKELLTEFGLPVKVTRAVGNSMSTVGTGVGAFTQNTQAIDSNGGLQTAVDAKTLVISKLPKDIEVGDQVTMDKVKYLVTSVNTSRPANKTVAYTCEVRHG